LKHERWKTLPFKFNPLPPSGPETEKNILEDIFSSASSQLKKYHPSENMKFNNSGIFQSFESRILMEKKSFQFLSS